MSLPPPRPPAGYGGRKLGKHEQRVLLQANDMPGPGFVQAFRASHQLSQALDMERTCAGNGQVAYLKKKQQQLAYVDEARRQPRAPLEALAAPEILRSEVRRDAANHHGAAGVPGGYGGSGVAEAETPAQREKRLAGQKEFLAGRKVRHDAALEEHDRDMDSLTEECQIYAQQLSEVLRKDLEGNDVHCNRLLAILEPPPMPEEEIEGDEEGRNPDLIATAQELQAVADIPLEGTMEPKKAKALSAVRIARASLAKLGEQSEEQVRGVMAALEGVRDKRRARVVDFAGEAGELAQLDTDRKLRTEALLKVLVDKLTAAAHAVHGEAERLVEQRAGSLNSVLLENRSSMKLLESKLTVQTLEVSKVNKARWHKGLLLWRRQRHRHSMQLVMRRIRSNEFRQPESIVEACEQIQDQQTAVFQARKDLTDELFGVSHKKLTVAVVRQFEEQNTGLNDRAQEGFDSMLSDLKDLREALEVSAEQMLGELGLQLELIDAKSEWKGHESVTGLIDAEVRPPLRDQLDQVAQLLVEVADSLSRQEELQHYAVTKMIAWFLALAKKQEQLKKRVEEFEVNYHGEVEDCEKDFEDESQRNEDSMNRLHDEINDAAHHETLDELKQKTFDHLDLMAVGYRGHADQLLNIHNRYPPGAAMLIRRETRGYCQDLGLALQPQEEAEAFATDRAEELAAAEAEAVAALGEEASEEAKEAAVQQLREAAAAREPEILQAEAAAAEALQEAAGWPEGSSTGCSVLERMSLHELRLEVVAEHLMSTTTGGTPPEAVEATPAVAEGGEEGAEGDMVPEHKEPAFADGTLALQALHFDDEWLEPRFGTVQKGIFKNLTSYVAHLGRVDTPMCCEEVRRDLDQQLRKHTNRKGEVQVEWYVPRYGTVAKHKDKFERHLVDVAQKCQDQDDAVDAIFQELQDAEAQYCQRLVSLRERLGEAQTLPVLTSFDRQANDFAAGFKDSCKSGLQRLLDLGSRAVQALQRDNRAFLNMCRSGDEQYSESEIQFYGAEVEELNTTLEQRGQQRTQRARELEGKFEEKRKTPLAEFSAAYAEAVELLCASKGLGRKYGEPRRKAQERVRTLMARAETVRQNIEQLLEYVQQLCSVHVPEDGSLEVSSIPRSPALIRIKDYFKRSGDAWTLPGELMGTVYVVVCTMSVLGTHLGAFKGAKAPNYQLAALPTLRVLREDETLMPPAEEQQQVQQLAQKGEAALPEERAAVAAAVKTATSLEMEAALRENCLMNVMGPLMKSEHYTGEIASIVKASNEAYAGQAGGTPDFMLKFLSEMQTHSEHTRQEAARGLRAWGTELREQTLLGLGEVLYAELTARSLAELRQATKEVRQKSVVRWAECDSLRTSHEQQLNPGLSNPNAETKLLALVDAEAARHEMALAMCGNDRENMAGVCRGAAEGFVCRLASLAESAIRLIDALPLHPHFGSLPGDEQMEPPRMSIKRRLRRLNAAEAAAETAAPPVPSKGAPPKGKDAKGAPPPEPEETNDGSLPERKWPGLPRFELRGQLLDNGWPADPLLTLAGTGGDGNEKPVVDAEKLQRLTETLVSFRSPVHRSIIDRRLFYYERYKAEFTAEVKRRTAELSAREEKERKGELNWQSMVRQLRGEEVEP